MNRGAGRRIIFPDDLHRHRFLDLLGEIHERYRDVFLRALVPSCGVTDHGLRDSA